MAVRIRLKRMGKIRAPFYRVVIMDSRSKRDGEAIEEIGKYHPTEDPSVIDIDSARVQYWLGVGAQPSEQVLALLKVTGDWAKFTGQDAPAVLQVKAPKPSKKDLYEAAVKAAGTNLDTKGTATTPRKRAAKAEAPAAPADAPADEAVAQAPEADAAEQG